ncbi:hypothetical protein D3C86_2154220 [compost metagenome]
MIPARLTLGLTSQKRVLVRMCGSAALFISIVATTPLFSPSLSSASAVTLPTDMPLKTTSVLLA